MRAPLPELFTARHCDLRSAAIRFVVRRLSVLTYQVKYAASLEACTPCGWDALLGLATLTVNNPG